MRILLITIYILISCSANLFPQWSNDPNNNLIVGYGLNPELCSDSAGGCYITYEVGYPSKLYLHRVDKYGYQPWGDKRIIAGELDEQSNAKIIEDGEGGVIVSFGDRIMFDSYRLRIQLVDSNGSFLWGDAGTRVSIVDTVQGSQRIVTDGDGGCVIVWIESDASEYRINRIDRNGQRVWSDSGLYIQSDYNSTPPRLIRASDGSYYVQIRYNLYRISKNGDIVLQDSTTLTNIVPDSEGGVVQSGRVWTGMIPKLVAQRKDSLGNNLWQEPYVEIADSLHINTLLNIQHSNDYCYYGWVGKKNGLNNRVQFQALRKDGSLLFSNGSVLLSSDSAISKMGIIPSHFSKVIFCWNIPGITNSTFSQMYDTLGNKLWNENGVIVAHPNILYQSFTTDGDGGFIIGGIINEFTVVAQQVNRYGKLGEIITLINPGNNYSIPSEAILYQNFPNPFNSSTVIKYSIPSESYITIELYNVIGELIKTIVDGYHNEGIYTVTLSSNDFPSGIYLYKMKTETQSLTKKLIIIK